jgi:hypothetical protein
MQARISYVALAAFARVLLAAFKTLLDISDKPPSGLLRGEVCG